MLEVGILLSALALAVASAALTLAAVERSGGRGEAPAEPGEEEKEGRGLMDGRRMQEGIANLLGYQVTTGKEEE